MGDGFRLRLVEGEELWQSRSRCQHVGHGTGQAVLPKGKDEAEMNSFEETHDMAVRWRGESPRLGAGRDTGQLQ